MNRSLSSRRKTARRWPVCNYASPRAYFVTVMVQDRRPVWGRVDRGRMVLTPAGRMVQSVWAALPNHFPSVRVDAFVVMPDHVHGILMLTEVGTVGLADVMMAFKSITSVHYIAGVQRAGWPRFNRRLWQRNYWDTVIRNDRHLNTVRRYIRENPARYRK